MWGVANRSGRIAEVVEAFDLPAIIDRPVASYSGGQRRRLEIARALLSRPPILFLDEPTVGLDPRIRHELLDLIATLRAENHMTVVVTTHYLDEAERLCDRVAIMHRGRLAATDTPAKLRSRLGDRIIEIRTDHDPAQVIATLRATGLAGDDVFTVGQTLALPFRDGQAAQAAAAISQLGIPVAEINSRPPTLDDIYLQLTGERIAA